MTDRLFGLETEYAFSAFGASMERVDQCQALGRLLNLAKECLPNLPDAHSCGMYLANGARFYIDCGKPEMTTPEVTTPWEACRFVAAGERILARLAAEMVRSEQSWQVVLSRCNFSYGPQPTTWACHESILHRTDTATMARHLIPHLASRIVYTGAGGFNNRAPGLEFMLSPRVAHLSQKISSDSTNCRGIYHDKEQALCRGHQRLHILCGESVCSETSLWLKMATTVLVVALIDAGFAPARPIRLAAPLAAMRTFATDVSLRKPALAQDGRQWTAIAIQEHYLDQAEAHLDHPMMPAWAPQACARWRDILNRLKQGPEAVTTTLDWAIKWALFQRLAGKRGVTWAAMPQWNHVLDRLHRASSDPQHTRAAARVTTEVLATSSRAADEVRRLSPYLDRHCLSWRQFGVLLDLREALFELDSRFGELGQRGAFTALDQAGVLNHRVDGVDNIDQATTTPPDVGRARLRGRCVQRLHSQRTRYACDWSAIWDVHANRQLDLSDPFATEEHWTPSENPSVAHRSDVETMWAVLRQRRRDRS